MCKLHSVSAQLLGMAKACLAEKSNHEGQGPRIAEHGAETYVAHASKAADDDLRLKRNKIMGCNGRDPVELLRNRQILCRI